MREKKLNMFVLIAIILVTLVLGIVIGYVVFGYLGNNQEVSENGKVEEQKLEEAKNLIKENTIVNNEKKQEKDAIQEKTEYDGEESINVDGKNYKFAYINEFIEETDEYGKKYVANMNTTLYLNNKVIKVFKNLQVPDTKIDFSNMIELTTILGENKEKYIVLKFVEKCLIDENIYLVIINKDEEILGTLVGQESNVGIILDEKTNGYNYVINEDNIIIYESMFIEKNNLKYAAAKYKVTINENYLNKEVIQIYTYPDEVTFAGK